jgi:hypothetical protein
MSQQHFQLSAIVLGQSSPSPYPASLGALHIHYEWAESNDIIILYPQVKSGPGNPNECWDWWGYTNSNYHTRHGKQMSAVSRMIDHLLAGDLLPPARAIALDPCLAWRWNVAPIEGPELSCLDRRMHNIGRSLHSGNISLQRLYVRQSFEPLFESPVTIAEPDRPIGTHVFTAVERLTGDASLRWTAVSLPGERPTVTVSSPSPARVSSGRDLEPMPTDPETAKTALDRIVIPQDALDRLAAVSSRSSLIVTDEALSAETGKGTDFVVLLSGEPQGGIKSRWRPSRMASIMLGESNVRRRMRPR